MAKVDLRNRAPKVERLPDSRERVTRTYDVLNWPTFTPAQILSDVWIAWGTADDKYTSCRLIDQNVSGQNPSTSGERSQSVNSPENQPSLLTRIFEQIDASLETSVGNADVTLDQDGQTIVTQESIQFSTGTAVYGVPGTTAAPAPWSTLVLKSETRTDDGTLRKIKRTYISGGFIHQDDDIKNEGALLIRTLTYVRQIPATPSGYTVIKQNVQYPNGIPVYTYTYAKGNGLIEKGIRQLEGGLRSETWVSFGTSYNAGTMQPNGILSFKNEEYLDGVNKYTATCMQTATGGDLTTGTTVLSFAAKHPFQYPGRAKAYMTTGTSAYTATDAGGQYSALFQCQMWDVFMSPPVEVHIDATVKVSYQQSPILSLGTTYWNPTEWATIEARFQPTTGLASRTQISALTGYRAINAGTALNFYAAEKRCYPSWFPGITWVTNIAYSVMGQTIYPLSRGTLVVYGGPVSPEGGTWVIDGKLEPAFTDTNGIQYYRKTEVVAVIPAQAAMPV